MHISKGFAPCLLKGEGIMSFLKEFKEFAFKGNVVDMAVGVMIGGAFSSIVTSVVNNLFMPLLSMVTGRIDFTKLQIVLAEGETPVVFAYGTFIQNVIDFILMAFCVFLFVKFINRFRKKAEPAPAKPARLCPYCKTAIADDATRCPHCTSQL